MISRIRDLIEEKVDGMGAQEEESGTDSGDTGEDDGAHGSEQNYGNSSEGDE